MSKRANIAEAFFVGMVFGVAVLYATSSVAGSMLVIMGACVVTWLVEAVRI